MGGGAPKNTTSTVKNEPPKWVQPYAESILQTGGQLAAQPYQPYPGATIAPMSPQQEAGIYAGTMRGTMGSPVVNAAYGPVMDTLGGGYLEAGMNMLQPYLEYGRQTAEDPWGMQFALNDQGMSIATMANQGLRDNPLMGLENPYLADAIQRAQAEQIPGLSWLANTSGSFGNSGINEAATRTMGDIASDMRMQDYLLQAQLQESDINRRVQQGETQRNAMLGVNDAYMDRVLGQYGQRQQAMLGQNAMGLNASTGMWNAERQRQMDGVGQALDLGAAEWTDIQNLLGIGDAVRGYEQEFLDQQLGEWEAAQQWPYQQIDWLTDLVRGVGFGSGGTSTAEQPNPAYGNPMATAIGGGLGLAGLLSALRGGF